jgi:hypothetical protein
MSADRRLTVERMVKLGRVSRSGFYRFDDADPGPDLDMALRDAIQKIRWSGRLTGGHASPVSCANAAGQ